ncbi:MAG TPA: ThiF family adenylyltransferase [Pseudonocardia sp.]|jgi:molybdopterin/thiamine biosynthesis adenylyltransferase|nr:ThiF family adenylyltransferase [Pseudonocardia sp.]
MSEWAKSIESCTFEFVEELERRGFRADGRTVFGRVGADGDEVRVEIALPDCFPFTPPLVLAPADFPRSWHRERNGAMCLYPGDGRDRLPWLDIDEFLALVLRWVVESRSGWPGDFPDLDLERYFPQAESPMVVYGDLDKLNNRFVQLRAQGHVLRLTGPGSIPRGKQAGKGRFFGYITNIGEPESPPASWDDLKAVIPNEDVKRIEKAVGDGRFDYLVVRYSRGGVGAAVVLRVWLDKSRNLAVASVRSASEAPATLMLRAGATAASLSQARVAVVGVGAIGSFVCDLLARAGVGAITAYDPDVVRPGNLVRHLAGSDTIGLSKPEAVKRSIEVRKYTATVVVPVAAGVPSPEEIMGLFVDNELVIDASASGDTTHLLASAATSGGHRILSVAIQEEGAVVRVDVIPPLQGDPIPQTRLGPPIARADRRFEAGCGDPVSQTPAFAVYEAASLAVRHAIGLLTGAPVSDAGTIREYR